MSLDVQARLLSDYHAITSRMHPLGTSLTGCASPGEAFLYATESELREHPRNLYDALYSDIAPCHRERFEAFLDIVDGQYRKLHDIAWGLKTKWKEADSLYEFLQPDALTADPVAVRAISQERMRTRNDFATTLALVSHREKVSDGMAEWEIRLKSWQIDEYALRDSIHDFDHIYLSVLRLFRLLLLEIPQENLDDVPLVLDRHHPMRWSLQREHRLLRFIESLRWSYQLAKGHHHQQDKSPLRRSGEAYILHPLQVALDTFLHGIISMIEDPHCRLDPAVPGIIGPAHDLDEDSAAKIVKFLEDIKVRANRMDTRISRCAESGYGENAKERLLRDWQLINNTVRRKVTMALMSLSHNTPFIGARVAPSLPTGKAGSGQSPTGASPSRSLCSLFSEFDGDRSQVYQEYPFSQRFLSEDGGLYKDDKKLLQMLTLTSEDILRHTILSTWYGDRTNNIETLTFPDLEDTREVSIAKLEKVHTYLHYTVIRPIAYGVYDHPWSDYPLSNMLHLLISVTLKQYIRLRDQYSYPLTSEDNLHITNLTAWLEKFPLQTLHAGKGKEALEEWEHIRSSIASG